GEKFMWYAPHSGFGNQLLEFKNALLIAAILNRTLIVPPVLDHHAVALGSCPKFRVLDPNELRFRVWNHSIQLLREGRYVSMADVMDLSHLVSSSAIRFIDFRAFVSMWCQVNLTLLCTAVSTEHSPFLEKLRQCGSNLSGYDVTPGNCLHALQEDCRTTVWTYRTGDEEHVLDSFQPSEELRRKRRISYSRYRKDIYRDLGPGSAAGLSNVLAFGSLFTAPYAGSESHIDIHRAPKDRRINSLIESIKFIPFVSDIADAGKRFALSTIKAPFFCVQLRLADGQFKNHRETTLSTVSETLDSLRRNGLPVNVFVMTDLPPGNWTGSYLGSLREDPGFKVFSLTEADDLVTRTAKKMVDGGEQCRGSSLLPDVLLYLEQSVCSCASMGFVGTSGSTIAEAISLMRENN
ncbi:hypothetical protein M569_02845, partial [Genlisea aurea]